MRFFLVPFMAIVSVILIRVGQGEPRITAPLPNPDPSKTSATTCVGAHCSRNVILPTENRATTMAGYQARNMVPKQKLGRSFSGKPNAYLPSQNRPTVPKSRSTAVVTPKSEQTSGSLFGSGAMQRPRPTTNDNRPKSSLPRRTTKVPKLNKPQGAHSAEPLSVKQPIMLTPADGQIPLTRTDEAFHGNSHL